MQQFEPLCAQRPSENFYTSEVAARAVQTGNETSLDCVAAANGDDRYRASGRFGCYRRSAASDDHIHMEVHQFGCQGRHYIKLTPPPAIFDSDVLTLDMAGFLKALAKCAQIFREGFERCGV